MSDSRLRTSLLEGPKWGLLFGSIGPIGVCNPKGPST